MNFGIVVFPGSNCDHDCKHVIEKVLGHEAVFIWHKDREFKDVDVVVLPGGFSYGDYLRSGAMAACSPIMDAVKNFANKGGITIGICNGFQILTEAKLLPGALMRNRTIKFICKDVFVRVEDNNTPFTCACKVGEILRMPVAHMDGNYFADKPVLDGLSRTQCDILKYCDENGELIEDANPNGALKSIAGIVNEKKNVFGLMPHPERSAEGILGNRDGIKIFKSITKWLSGGR